MKKSILSSLLLAGLFVGPVNAQSPAEIGTQPQESTKLVIADGSPVQLRFSQAVWGLAAGWRPRPVHAHPGDIVRMVVAEDLVVGGKVVIQKGSAAQATVDSVWMPTLDRHGVPEICTCLSLKLNWAKSLDDQDIALRSLPKGKPEPFTVQVHSTRAGAIAKPLSLKQAMIGALEQGFLLNIREMMHRRDWIPPGTRITAYVQGDSPLNNPGIEEAQARLPMPNEAGLVMIYRTKGQKDQHPRFYCDSKEMGQIGSRQYLLIQMDPGKHSCRAEQGDALEFDVTSGEEYYLDAKFGSWVGNWKLSLVNKLEGEDGVGAAEPAPDLSKTQDRGDS
ncbi:MAG TPA: hypothetical protein VI431_05115 [Candidatus Acidoferrum sp.]